MRQSALLHKRLQQNNPQIQKLVENVQFHPSLRQDAVKFVKLWEGQPISLDAKNFGSPSTRPRQYVSDICSLQLLQHAPYLPPSAVLQEHRHCTTRHVPCVVASPRTYTVPQVMDVTAKFNTRLSIGESERVMGWPDGITNLPDAKVDSYTDQLSRIGNALNAHQLYHILQHLIVPSSDVPPPVVAAVDARALTAPQLEAQLGAMSDRQLHQWVSKRLHNWKPAPPHLILKPGQQPFAKPKRGYSTPAGLVESMEYMVQEQIRKGYLEEVEYEQGMFVSQGFVQAKPGRTFPGTSIPMCRLLVDCCALNSACVESPWHHYGCCPDQVDMCSRVPLGAKFYRYYDLSDAFHTCPIAEESANLVVAQFNGKFYRYLGAHV